MCGILGIIGSPKPELLDKLVKTISHRGPDSNGIFSEGKLSMLHTRLSIQDLSSNAHQPMISEDGNYVIIFNGEIYNHQEIRESLAGKYNFKSTSDTETLLYGFIEEGRDILVRLKGIFSFAVYNRSSGELFMARDQFGVKPLYYYQNNNVFLFGSEIKAFIRYPDFDKTVDHKSLVNYLHFGWSPGEITPFKHVKKLLPGHYAEINVHSPGQFNIFKYYDVPFNGKYFSKTEEELINELEEKLKGAVKRQLLSDVPLGFFLSGGLDSSALVAITRKMYPDRKIQCFTVATKGMQESEGFSEDLKYAQQVAKYLKVDLEVVDSSERMLEDFDKIIYHLDEPLADSAPLHLLKISQRAKQMGYKVLISGTGGDDIFSGYRRHQALQLEGFMKRTPGFVLNTMKILLKPLKIKIPAIRRWKKLFMNDVVRKENRLASYYSVMPIKKNKNLFKENIQKEISSFDPSSYLKDLLHNIPEEHSDLNHMLYWEMKTYLPDHNLNYTDKIGMMAGVEVRVPFLDKELVQFSTRIPLSLKMRGTTTKYLLKKLMERYLPKEVIYRSKTGFGIPPGKLLEKELRPIIKDYLSPKNIAKRGIFKPEKIQSLIRSHNAGYIDASYPIWCLLAIESWHRQFVDGLSSSES